MTLAARSLVFVFAVAMALPIVIDAQSTPATARSETRLQLGDLLRGDQRPWEAIRVYTRAKEGATQEQLVRASTGLLDVLMQVAEFTRALREAEILRALAPENAEAVALSADAQWAAGLFDEAEQIYRDVLVLDPESGRARHGLAKCLATKLQYDEALDWVQSALDVSPNVAVYQHTLGYLYQRMHRFPEAADAYDRYVDLLAANNPDTDKVSWARAEVRLLRSFGDRPAVQIADPGPHTIPFRLVRDKVIVRGKVNGHPPIDLVVDTGAEQTVLSQRVARQVGVQPVTNVLSAGVGERGVRGLQAGRIESLQIGPLEMFNLPALIKSPPLGGLPTAESDGFSPLALGLSMTIDYARNHLIIGEELPAEQTDIVLPLRQHRLTVVRGVVNGEHQRSFVVDTGGEVISISRGTAALLPPMTVRQVPLKVYGTSGWDEGAYLRPGINLSFNQIRYSNFSVVVLNLHRPSALLGFHIGGIVGHTFFRDYRVTFDLQRSVMNLEKI